jgi:hypothetical protein
MTKRKIKYKARAGAPFKPSRIQKIGEWVTKLTEKNKGVLKPQQLIDDAQSFNSPFHNLFEWDNTKAAKKYRLGQARDIINHIVVVMEVENKEMDARAFFSVRTGKDNNEFQYVTLKESLTEPNYRLQVINETI